MSKKQPKKLRKLYLSALIVLVLTVALAFFINRISKPQLQKSEAYIQEPSEIDTDPKPEGVIIKYKDEKPQTRIAKLKRHTITGKDPEKISNRTYAITTGEENVEKTIEEIKNEEESEIEYIEPDYERKLHFTPNDPLFKDQWWLKKIDAERTWDIIKGSNQVTVAVIDTGMSLHPDLSPNIKERYNLVGTNLDDPIGHGTQMGGIIGAVTNNNLGIASMGYNLKLISLKVVIKRVGGAKDSDIIKAINKAVEQKADIISISLGGEKKGQALQDAINYAWSKGLFIVASAGNDGKTKQSYPAAYDHVFSVAATDNNDSKASFSNYGGWVDIAAPGVDILSTNNKGGYEAHSGTSPAAPMVSAVAALIKAKYPNYTNSQIEQKLCESADKINKTGEYWKCGRLNAYKALGGASPYQTSTPQPTSTPNPTLPPNPENTLSFQIRFQGINQKAKDQKIDIEIYKDSSLIIEEKSQNISNNENGIYTFYLDNSDNKITPGTYTIRIKGESHLAKKFANIEIKSTNDNIDLSKQELKAGDLNGDNKITIEDIAQILAFYVTFSKDVDNSNQKMVNSDINKDGKITIIDVALAAINWSNLTVNGE